jgi:hypothetical protein
MHFLNCTNKKGKCEKSLFFVITDPTLVNTSTADFKIYIIFNDNIPTDADILYRLCDVKALSEEL